MSFQPSENTFGKVLSNNVPYVIPRYQRKYVWGIKEWNDLLEDILISLENVPENGSLFPHFLISLAVLYLKIEKIRG